MIPKNCSKFNWVALFIIINNLNKATVTPEGGNKTEEIFLSQQLGNIVGTLDEKFRKRFKLLAEGIPVLKDSFNANNYITSTRLNIS